MSGAINPEHPMTQLATENAQKFIALVIWKLRKHCPNLAVEITDRDMREMSDVFMSNGQRGVVAVIGKANGIVLQLVDEQSGRALQQQQGEQQSADAEMMAKALAARKRLPALANRLRHDADVKRLGKPLAYEVAEVLDLLMWEPKS